MSNLSYVLIADDSSGPDIGACPAFAEQHWPALLLRDLSDVNLAQVYCAITGEEYHSNLLDSMEMVGGGRQEEGPRVFAIPVQMQDAIAHVPLERITSCSVRLMQEWGTSVEMTLGRPPGRWSTVESVEWLIGELSAHARRALEGGQSLYLMVDLWSRSIFPGEGWERKGL